MERKDRHERPAQKGERRHVEDQNPRLRGGKRVILDRQDDDRGENEDEREEERPPRDSAVVIVRLTGPQVSESDPQIRPRGHVEDDGDPREEEVEVDRAHVRHRDNPPTGCEGRPEDGATQAEGDSPALQVAGPEGAARGRTRVGDESRHGRGGIVFRTSIRLLTKRRAALTNERLDGGLVPDSSRTLIPRPFMRTPRWPFRCTTASPEGRRSSSPSRETACRCSSAASRRRTRPTWDTRRPTSRSTSSRGSSVTKDTTSSTCRTSRTSRTGLSTRCGARGAAGKTS